MYACQADAICDHIGRYRIGERLEALATALGIPMDRMVPDPESSPNLLTLDSYGLQIVLRYCVHSGPLSNAADYWFISDVLWGPAWSRQLPFGLSKDAETIPCAVEKLGTEATALHPRTIARNGFRQSFFLEDAFVVELLWREDFTGIDRVWVARLGKELAGFSDLPTSSLLLKKIN